LFACDGSSGLFSKVFVGSGQTRRRGSE